MIEGESNVEQREKDVETREQDVEQREAVLDARVAAAESILTAAEQRGTDADDRDLVADTRDEEADRAAFVSSDPDYGDRFLTRRHAATDRGNAKDDRHHSADDREKLTQDTVARSLTSPWAERASDPWCATGGTGPLHSRWSCAGAGPRPCGLPRRHRPHARAPHAPKKRKVMTMTPAAAPTTPTAATTMRAVVQNRYGSAEVLYVENVVIPSNADGEVLVRVHAAGVDRGTWHLMKGKPYLVRLAFGIRRPKNPVPGMDVAGTVAAVGSAVTAFVVGDEVYGFGRGTFAQYTVAPEDKLARKPIHLSFEQAAVVPVSGITALQGLREVGHLEAGQSVLVIGASGGVGSYAVQLAKAFGAEVIGVASTAKLDLVRSLGADHVVDYTVEDFAAGARRYDLVLDIAGNPTLSRLRRALKPTGTAVITGGEEGGSFSGGMSRQLRAVALSPFLHQRLAVFIAKQRASDLEQLNGLVETGKLRPGAERTYPLEETADAIRHLEAGRVRGKVAIAV